MSGQKDLLIWEKEKKESSPELRALTRLTVVERAIVVGKKDPLSWEEEEKVSSPESRPSCSGGEGLTR